MAFPPLHRLPPILAGLLAASVSPALADDSLRISRITLGAEVARLETSAGRDLRVLSLPMAIGMEAGRWTGSVRAARLHVKEKGDGGRDIEGFGDTTLTLGYRLRPWQPDELSLTLSGYAKIPTAEADLGTGRVDTGLQLDSAMALGRWTPFGSLGYRIVGRLEDRDMGNVWNASLGLQRSLGSGKAVGAYALYRESIFDAVKDYQDAVVYMTLPLAPHWSVQAYGSAGFGARAGGLGGGIHLRFVP